MVIGDAPPVGVVADAMVLSVRVDGVILVLQPKFTRLEVASQTVSKLRVAGANLIVLVSNKVPLKQRANTAAMLINTRTKAETRIGMTRNSTPILPRLPERRLPAGLGLLA